MMNPFYFFLSVPNPLHVTSGSAGVSEDGGNTDKPGSALSNTRSENKTLWSKGTHKKAVGHIDRDFHKSPLQFH